MTRVIGYVRVSTADQDASLQRDALADLASEIVQDVMTGSRADRPGLRRALDMLQPGDTLAVWKLDRLGRSVRQLVDTVHEIEERGANLICTTQAIDTRTPGGRMLFHIIGAMAEFERDLIRERVTAGMKSAKKAGRHVGRAAKMDADRTAEAHRLLDAGKSWGEVCWILGIGRATLSRALARYPKEEGAERL